MYGPGRNFAAQFGLSLLESLEHLDEFLHLFLDLLLALFFLGDLFLVGDNHAGDRIEALPGPLEVRFHATGGEETAAGLHGEAKRGLRFLSGSGFRLGEVTEAFVEGHRRNLAVIHQVGAAFFDEQSEGVESFAVTSLFLVLEGRREMFPDPRLGGVSR